MKIVHNKNTKVTENVDKITYEHELTTLEKYVEITSELSSVENKAELVTSWLVLSSAILGAFVFLNIFLAFIYHSDSVILDTSLLFYGCLCVLAFTAKDSLYLLLVLNITKSNFTMRDKLNKIEQHHLVSGRYLMLTKCIIVILSVLLLFSFAAYFTSYLPHPFLTSLFIYLSLLTAINIVRKNIHFVFHISFAILTALLCVYNLFVLADVRNERYDEENQYNESQPQSDIESDSDDSADSIREFIDSGMYEMMQEQERRNDLVYKPEPLPTK
jgi:hypothetical protein